jgi:hypothetical protein
LLRVAALGVCFDSKWASKQFLWDELFSGHYPDQLTLQTTYLKASKATTQNVLKWYLAA